MKLDGSRITIHLTTTYATNNMRNFKRKRS